MKLRALKSMLVLACAAGAGQAMAAEDIFLKLSGIAGDATDDKHRGEIVVKAYSQTVSNTGGNGGDITVSKNLDPSSPALITSVLTGTLIRDGLITFRRGGRDLAEYYTVQLVGISVSSVEQVDSSASGVTEVVKLKARQFMYTFRPQRPDGSLGTPLTFGFDCVSNQRL
jgi:type VI secretion system secreted protein Hcp